jgi:hypothetical protein
MKLATLAFLAFVAALAFLTLFIADREKQAGVERKTLELQDSPSLDAG